MATRLFPAIGAATRRPLFRVCAPTRTLSSRGDVLYENNQKRPALYMFIGGISIVQLVFWGYLSWFAYKGLDSKEMREKISSSEEEDSKSKVVSSSKWRLFAAALAMSAGVFFAYTANMLTFRTVVRLRVAGRGNSLLLTTYTPWGSTRQVEAPLSRMHSVGQRLGTSPQVTIKVEGYPLFFLVDKKGHFPDPRGFDSLVVSRNKT